MLSSLFHFILYLEVKCFKHEKILLLQFLGFNRQEYQERVYSKLRKKEKQDQALLPKILFYASISSNFYYLNFMYNKVLYFTTCVVIFNVI